MIRLALLRLSLLSLYISMVAAAVAAQPDDVVLAENALVKLTRADYETALSRVPAELRANFASDRKRITGLLNNLLVAKTLAEEARRAGMTAEAAQDATDADRLLAKQQVQRIEEAAAAEFDARVSQWEPRIRELYLVNKQKYRKPEEISVSHILFTTRTRSEEEAAALAEQTRARLLAGADFAEIAREVSDHPTAKSDGGRMDWFSAGQKDAAFAKPAFELANVGDVSKPVRTSAGYHLIRLEGRRPEAQLTFDEVRPQIVAELRQQYVDQKREIRINAIRNDPQLKVNQREVDALLVRVDPRMMKPRPRSPNAPPTMANPPAKPSRD